MKYAYSIGAIRIDKKGGITPVKGKTRVKNGKLYYVTGKRSLHERRVVGDTSQKRAEKPHARML